MKARVNGVLRQRKDPASLTSCLEKIWKLERETTGFHVKNHARAIHEATQFRFHRIHFSQFSCLGEKHRRGRTRSTPKLWPICCRKTLTSINIALIKPPCRNLTAHMHIHRGDATSLCICCSERDELRADRMKLFDRFSLWQSLLYNLVWFSPPKKNKHYYRTATCLLLLVSTYEQLNWNFQKLNYAYFPMSLCSFAKNNHPAVSRYNSGGATSVL